MSQDNLVPHLKKDAVVSVNIGTGYITQLSAVIHHILANKTDKDVQRAQELINQNKPLEPWMQSIQTLQLLIQEIFKQGEKQGMVEYRPITPDSLPSDQVSEQK